MLWREFLFSFFSDDDCVFDRIAPLLERVAAFFEDPKRFDVATFANLDRFTGVRVPAMLA